MANTFHINFQDELNRCMPIAERALLGTWLYELTQSFNALEAKYNALLAHLDTGNVTGIGNTNAATYGYTTTVPTPDQR